MIIVDPMHYLTMPYLHYVWSTKPIIDRCTYPEQVRVRPGAR